MDADSWRRGDISHVMDVVRTERSYPAGFHHQRRRVRTTLLQRARGDDERARGCSVVVKAGALSRQPAEEPDLIAVANLQALVPAAAGIEPDPLHPVLRPVAEPGHDVREILSAVEAASLS